MSLQRRMNSHDATLGNLALKLVIDVLTAGSSALWSRGKRIWGQVALGYHLSCDIRKVTRYLCASNLCL